MSVRPLPSHVGSYLGRSVPVPSRCQAEYVLERQIPGVVLELKYEDRLPAWMQELVRMFGLETQSVPKYGLSIEAFYEPDIRVIPGIELWKLATA